ncbi:MAG: ABC transporter permease [Clostridiales bacterium]|nr:ABC transporter permease [Clostridiales bacterium]
MEDNTEKKVQGERVALDDVQRVKVLSPGMMVYKRFIRNKLAIVGMVILVIMFLFSFLGGFLYPYGQAQVFKGVDFVELDYAVATYNTEPRFTDMEGVTTNSLVRAQLLKALGSGQDKVIYDGVEYVINKEGEDFYRIGGNNPLAEADVLRVGIRFKPSDKIALTDEFVAAFTESYEAGDDAFDFGGETYQIVRESRKATVAAYQDLALASKLIFDAYDAAQSAFIQSYEFKYAAQTALNTGDTAFTCGGRSFTLEINDKDNATVYDESGAAFANLAAFMIIPPVGSDIFLPVAFKQVVTEAILDNKQFFYSDTATGEELRFDVQQFNANYRIKSAKSTEVILLNQPPSAEHPMGTDHNGMDMLARLMYGGRVSLTVGFVVVIIETLIGVIIGGVSGYFGGWVDTLLMRFVELFNAIPAFPMLIILGSILEAYRVEPMMRIYILMLILGLLYWTNIARTVRGQILSLREQDFMVAAEASGISNSRRIFKHLVPNVMPLLIVNATMGLGGIILTEATLSFLGLGVKYPLASWGSISNAATSVTVMTFYPWSWIPAGILIFTTVLGFNFVGDGLRDAFDPKMKR